MWRCRPCWATSPSWPAAARRRIKLPRAPLFPLAYGAEAVARVTGKEPFLTADALRMSRYRMFFSSAKAKRELGYTARPYQRRPEGRAGLVPRERVSAMIAGILFGFLPLAIWLYLLLCRGGFWLLRERDTDAGRRSPPHWPSVVAVVPARNEADVIQRSIGSLLAQDYPGDFHVMLVDDQSATTAPPIWRAALDSRPADGADRRRRGRRAGPASSGRCSRAATMRRQFAPEFLWFTDADIAHAPDNLRQLVARAEDGGQVLVSLMARLSLPTAPPSIS